MSSSIAIIGDVGGHLERLETVLLSLGCDPESGNMSDGLEVVQVGDLVRLRQGFEEGSLGVVRVVNRFLQANPHRWHQLWGNHDLAVLGGDRMGSWDGSVDSETAATMRAWWDGRLVRFAVTVSADEDVLVTHAGVTIGAWRKAVLLGATNIFGVARVLNSHLESLPPGPLASGDRLVKRPTNNAASCVWSEVCQELADPWVKAGRLPFSQVHGHASVWNWVDEAFWADATTRVQEATTVDHKDRRCVINVGGRSLTSVDSGLVSEVGEMYPLLVLNGQVVD